MAPEDESKSPLNRLEHKLNFRTSPRGARIVSKPGMNVHIFPEIGKSREVPNTFIPIGGGNNMLGATETLQLNS